MQPICEFDADVQFPVRGKLPWFRNSVRDAINIVYGICYGTLLTVCVITFSLRRIRNYMARRSCIRKSKCIPLRRAVPVDVVDYTIFSITRVVTHADTLNVSAGMNSLSSVALFISFSPSPYNTFPPPALIEATAADKTAFPHPLPIYRGVRPPVQRTQTRRAGERQARAVLCIFFF